MQPEKGMRRPLAAGKGVDYMTQNEFISQIHYCTDTGLVRPAGRRAAADTQFDRIGVKLERALALLIKQIKKSTEKGI